jgi:hypothetical protein
LVWCEPEDVDVAFFVVGVGGFAELGEEGGSCVWRNGRGDQRQQIAGLRVGGCLRAER